ncbi:MAG: lamin tail domain-containing protein [Myxococcota bacterium]
MPTSWAWASNLLITEVYANAPGRSSDTTREWVELYNVSDHPIALTGLIIRRIDGVKSPKEAWRIVLQQSDVMVPVGGYAIVAQSADLGLGLCPQIPLHVVADERFSLKNSGVQQLCIQQAGQQEQCVQFSDSKTFPDGQSRHLPTVDAALGGQLSDWRTEDCPLPQEALGSPGFAFGACHSDTFSAIDPWYADWICPQLQEDAAQNELDDPSESNNGDAQQQPQPSIEPQQTDPKLLALAQQPLPQLQLHARQQSPQHVVITCQTATADFGPLLHMDIYASTHPDLLLDGILLATAVAVPTQPQQPTQTAVAVAALPSATYSFFGRLRNVAGQEAHVRAPESIAIDNTIALPNLRITQAEMQQLSSARQAIHLSWSVEPAMLGNLTLYARDTTNSNTDWQTVVTGLPNPDSGGKYVWYPADASEKSRFEVYGLLRVAQGSVTSAQLPVVPAPQPQSCRGATPAATAGQDTAFVLLWAIYRAAQRSSTRRRRLCG